MHFTITQSLVRTYCEMFSFLGLLSAWNKAKVSEMGISTVYAKSDTDHILSDVWLLSVWNKAKVSEKGISIVYAKSDTDHIPSDVLWLSVWNKTKVSEKDISTVYAKSDTDHIPSDVWWLSVWNKAKVSEKDISTVYARCDTDHIHSTAQPRKLYEFPALQQAEWPNRPTLIIMQAHIFFTLLKKRKKSKYFWESICTLHKLLLQIQEAK